MNTYIKLYVIYHFLLCTLSLNIFKMNASDNFSILVKPKWRDLDHGNTQKSTLFGGKWLLVGSITFKKHCKEPMFIDALSLHWNGEAINNLIASLYRKENSKNFLPIEKHLICDGVWNKNKQTMVFNFEDKETLSPTTTFYLVLTIPQELETIVMNGSFILEESYLPKPFKQCAQTAQLNLHKTFS